MIDSTETILHAPRGTIDSVYSWGVNPTIERVTDFIEYIEEVFRLAPLVGIDPAIVVAQSAHETGDWTSYWWRERLNPAGIGITGDPVQNEASHTWQNGTEAARAHIVHLWLYCDGIPGREGLMPTEISPYRDLDPRRQALIDSGWVDTVVTLADLTGKWAVDPNYGKLIAGKFNVIFGGTPMPTSSVTFGRVPHPAFQDRPIPGSHAWDNLGPRTIRAVVWHRMLGSLWGTDTYFRGEALFDALTDYGVGVLAQDGAAADGLILRWNDPRGERSPWANGEVSAPYGDGKAFIDQYGINAVNRDATAIEISGFENTPLSEASRNAVANLTAYWADQYRVSWETFPLVPSEGGRSFVIWHREFTIGTGKECPFAVVMDETPEIIERTKAVLKRWQTGPAPTKWAPKHKPPFDENGRASLRFVNGDVWHPVNAFMRTTRVVTPREWATESSRPTGPDLPIGKRVKVAYVVSSEDELWYVGWGGSRMLANGFVP